MSIQQRVAKLEAAHITPDSLAEQIRSEWDHPSTDKPLTLKQWAEHSPMAKRIYSERLQEQ